MDSTVCFLGAGSFGTALAVMLGKKGLKLTYGIEIIT